MEYLAGAIALILLLWACSGGKRTPPKYSIVETADDRYCEVVDNDTGRVEFVGAKEQCENWIESHR
ncbi:MULTISPECIES: hypothetical protein [unclassified Adlercreutzia]|uniref:hypothetical protein n=1 Tax=unclassified Adlercreutzia TaxID=2636013 RepID=UPI0013ED58D0|nr:MULTISPECIES: hypothetical protein [unclassified Adlercreutzia]